MIQKQSNRILLKELRRMDKLQILNKCFIILIPLVISMSSFVIGYFMVYYSMMEQYIQAFHGYSSQQTELYFTLTTSLLPIGAFIATFFYSKMVQIYGENKIFKIMDVIAVVAILLQMITVYTPVLCISRFLMGLFCGICSGVVPSYIVSLSPSFTSGIIGSFNQISIALGMAFAYYMGQLVDSDLFSSSKTSIIVLVGFPLICISVHLVVIFLFPFDNIQRHISKRENITVRKYLKMVYGKNWRAFQLQIRNFKIVPVKIVTENEKSTKDLYEQENLDSSQSKCNCPKLNFYLIGIMLAFANQFSGITAILQYAKQLFLVLEDGDEDSADNYVLILGFFQFFVTIIGGFLINRFGRRLLMLSGVGIIIVSLLIGLIITTFIEEHQNFTIFVIFTHNIGYSISLGPICMLYAVEALENIQIVLSVNWGLTIIISLISDLFIQSIEIYVLFAVFAFGSILSFIFFAKFMVESKDTSRKMIRQSIEGTKIDWEKSSIAFSKSIAMPKKQNNIEKKQETI